MGASPGDDLHLPVSCGLGASHGTPASRDHSHTHAVSSFSDGLPFPVQGEALSPRSLLPHTAPGTVRGVCRERSPSPRSLERDTELSCAPSWGGQREGLWGEGPVGWLLPALESSGGPGPFP